METIAIIGGGASGLVASISAAEHIRRIGSDANVVIYESSDRIGKPILRSGNGRCNFSNADLDPCKYHNAKFAEDVLLHFETAFRNEREFRSRFEQKEMTSVVQFFVDRGMLIREEGDGRLYPYTGKASTLLDVLRTAISAHGIKVQTDARVALAEPPSSACSRFTLHMADGRLERADAVIMACGGDVAREMLPEQVRFKQLQPMLCPIATDPHLVRKLDNIRAKCTLSLKREDRVIASERGEVMFRKYGISGVAAFNLSRFAQPGDMLSVNFVQFTGSSTAEFLGRRAKIMRKCLPAGYGLTNADVMSGIVLPLVGDVLLEFAGLDPHSAYSKSSTGPISRALTSFELEVRGVSEIQKAQVRRGGIDVGCVDPRTCGINGLEGLFATGEALDVDGPCGGYNLHWAWASGYLAGRSAALSITCDASA